VKKIRMDKIVGVEDHQDLVLISEMLQPIVQRGHLVVEGGGRFEKMDAGIAEVEVPDVAVVGDDINVKASMGLLQERIDDRGDEIGLPMGGDDDPELILLADGPERGRPWPEAEKPGSCIDEQENKGMEQEGDEEQLSRQVQIPQNNPRVLHWMRFKKCWLNR